MNQKYGEREIIVNNDFTKVTLVNEDDQRKLSAQSLADSIVFQDGETLQYKYDNGKLIDGFLLSGLEGISPTVEIYENTNESFKLKIKSISGTIITPNLRSGPDIETDTESELFEKSFINTDFTQNNDKSYVLTIKRDEHKLGFKPIIVEVLRRYNNRDLTETTYSYKILVNGDLLLYSHEPYDGIIYLKGDQN